jgi:hypothetical protein
MSDEDTLQHLPVPDLADHCARETNLYHHGKTFDPRYCFELFRRAIVARDNQAWDAIYAQYQGQVERWVYRHPDFASIDQEVQDFTLQAFERFSKYFTSEKFSKSQSLAAVLNYLQTCVHGVILDCWRKMRQTQLEQLDDVEEGRILDKGTRLEDLLEAEELWQLIAQQLKDKKEQIVVQASFQLNLSPREIMVEYPDVFRDISEIYQCKANVLARFERDPAIRNFAQRE